MEKNRLTREALLLTHIWRSSSRCEHLLLAPLPQHRPVLSAAFYFLLHLTKGGRGNWFYSLMFLLFCVSAISRPPAGCECVFIWITERLYNSLLISYCLGLVCPGGFFSERCLHLVTRGFRQKFFILFFAVCSPEWETLPSQL